MTVASRVPGPESQSPRPPRASPTTARSPRAGRPAPHNGLGTRPPPNGAVEGLPHATSGRRSPEVRAVPTLSRPRATSYPLACSVSSSLSPSIPHVSWSSSSRLCWLAADSLSSAIAAAPSGWEGGAPSSKQGATGRARPQLPLVPPTLGHGVWSLRPRPSRRSRPSQPARPRPLPCGSRLSVLSRPLQSEWAPPTLRAHSRPPHQFSPSGSQGPAYLAFPLPPILVREDPLVWWSRFRLG